MTTSPRTGRGRFRHCLSREARSRARLEDLQGRFNLNNLVFADGTTNPEAVLQLARILAWLDLEPTWASAMADWIDEDTQPGFPDGAEDSVYTGQSPPYLAANMPITRASELLSLPGFGAERYAKLKPYVTALPVGTKLNVCTAPGIVLDALIENVREFGLSPEDLAKRRESGCFPTLDRPARIIRRRGVRQGQGHRSRNRAISSAQRYGSLLAPRISRCTVSSCVAREDLCVPSCAVSEPNDPPEARCLRRW